MVNRQGTQIEEVSFSSKGVGHLKFQSLNILHLCGNWHFHFPHLPLDVDRDPTSIRLAHMKYTDKQMQWGNALFQR